MGTFLKWGRRLLSRPPSPPRQVRTAGFTLLDNSDLIEEENLAWYKPSQFYPVRIGEVFNARYQALGKLGFGAYSTVWLCRDLVGHKYVALKVCERDSAQARREVEVYRHLNSLYTRHVGFTLVRTMLDSFEITGLEGQHQCLVHKPLGMSLKDLHKGCPSGKYPEDLLKPTLIHILLALDFLHGQAKVVHTDLKQDNIMLGVEDEIILADFEKAEDDEPSARKVDGDRVIYVSRELGLPKVHGRPVLCDFGEARLGAKEYDDEIQPYQYRAPEVILNILWNEKVDIWNLGVMVWDLFQNRNMFKARDADGERSDAHHLAEMVALLGPPPKELLTRSETVAEYFTEDGTWKRRIEIPAITLEESEGNLSGNNKIKFLEFMRKMLHWIPEERLSAEELLRDPWLRNTIED